MEVFIRNAAAKDSEAISELSEQLGYKSSNKIIRNRLNLILKNDSHFVFVAVSDEKIIAWIHGFYSLRIESEAFVEIGGLVVNENYRKNGVGKILVESAIKWSEARNCKKIRVRSNIIRTDSHKFYEKMAFKLNKEQKVFDKQLK